MEIVLQAMTGRPLAPGPVEIVERKGVGHPDTMCDGIAEEIGRTLCRHYEEHFGVILHHNVDKVLLVGGRSEPAFGGGRVLEPVELYLAGRATREVRGRVVPVDDLAVEAAKRWVRTHVTGLDVERHLVIHPRIRPGSPELVELFERSARTGRWLANDTSCGVGHAPLSGLERLALTVEDRLRAPELRQAFPMIGDDVKVMGVRHGLDVGLTVATAFVDRHVGSLEAYVEQRSALREALGREASSALGADLGADLAVDLNAADDPDRGSIYLTVTGTSAEAGDDGEAGRGNRENGLITPFRPMTLESVAGKNPVSHVGKIYNVVARRLAERLVAERSEVAAAECHLVSTIGRPVREPQLAHVRVEPADAGAASAVPGLHAWLRQVLRDDALWDVTLAGR
ncbi:MAG: methionine adenosyltransferase [Sandaracinaceae bacterium]